MSRRANSAVETCGTVSTTTHGFFRDLLDTVLLASSNPCFADDRAPLFGFFLRQGDETNPAGEAGRFFLGPNKKPAVTRTSLGGRRLSNAEEVTTITTGVFVTERCG